MAGKIVARCVLCGGFVARVSAPASVEAVCTNHRCGATMEIEVKETGETTIKPVERVKPKTKTA